MTADSLISACHEMFCGLTKEDRRDMRELLPYLLDDDPDEREAAEVAVREILAGGPVFAIPAERLWQWE